MTASGETSQRSKWFALVWVVPVILVVLGLLVLLANWLRDLPSVQSFTRDYPGESKLLGNAPVGFPAWLAWQHYINVIFLLLIVRTGWEIRTTTRPSAYWTRNNRGPLRTKNAPRKISLILWFHLSLDALWVLNGIVFYVLIFTTGQWMRLIPVRWDVFPNAISTLIQYVSLHWPNQDGWINYNALQLLSYFVIVFVAAPLAIVTGLRMSPAWPLNAKRLNALYPVELARAIHFPTMLFFVLFVIVHVTLVFAEGPLRNVNHMYALRDDQTWWGFGIFFVGLVVMAAAWIGARPLVLRTIASRSGTVTRQ
jgi:thiosulfate reductase cytochrome b subunit